MQSTITIIGCGYVGLTTAAILANCGMTVYALETDQTRIEAIKNGRSFFYEEGVNRLLAAGLSGGTLLPTDDYHSAIPASDYVFSCVGTPDNDDGSANLSYVYAAARQAAELMKPGSLFIQKSTVPVGTGVKLQPLFAAGKAIGYVSNPEFLREGTAVRDSLWFDRIVAGSDDAEAARAVIELYMRVEAQRDVLASLAGLSLPEHEPADPRYIATSLSSAELTKVSANAFLALKISFANSIAKLADRTGANITEVMDAVGADKRIGRAFLHAGRGYGGGCFPKDVSSLIRSAEDHGADMEIMSAAAEVNDSMPHYIIHKAEQKLGRRFEGLRVAVLGLAFKAGTSDVRRSPGIIIANTLAAMGATVGAHDPEAMAETVELAGTVRRYGTTQEAVRDADVIFITTDWPEFKRLGSDGLADGKRLLVDCMNCLDPSSLPPAVSYIGVGR